MTARYGCFGFGLVEAYAREAKVIIWIFPNGRSRLFFTEETEWLLDEADERLDGSFHDVVKRKRRNETGNCDPEENLSN